MTTSESQIQPLSATSAAGAVVWRGSPEAPEVAVIHRPRYDDWSFPKGKRKPGEHVITAALREVHEETGLRVVLGRYLPPVHYLKDTRLKRVDYWLARAVAGEDRFQAGAEVDELVWLPVAQARRRLTYEWDLALLRAVTEGPLATTPLILLRHAWAGSRQEWRGDDTRRPLDRTGTEQALSLAGILAAYRPRVLVSSPSKRCVQTVRPYSLKSGAEIRRERALEETSYDPRRALAAALELLDAAEPAVLCSHGKVLPELIGEVCRERLGHRPRDTYLRKGAFAVLHHVAGRVVGVERYLV